MSENAETSASGGPRTGRSGVSALPPPSRLDARSRTIISATAERRDRLLAALTLIAGIAAVARAALRAAGRVGLLPAAHRRDRHRDRAGAVARMARAAPHARAARRADLRAAVPRSPRTSRWPRSWCRHGNGCAICPSGSTDIQSQPQAADRFLREPRTVREQDAAAISPASRSARQPERRRPTPPRSLLDLFATSAPSALIEMFFAILVDLFLPVGLDPAAAQRDHQPRRASAARWRPRG